MAEPLTAAEIKELMHEVMEEQRRNFWVEPEQHFLDHDMLKSCRQDRETWRKNHDFITGVREASGTAKKAGIGFIITAIGGLFIWMVRVVWVASVSAK